MKKSISPKAKKVLTDLAWSAGAAVFWIGVWAAAAAAVGQELILPSPGQTFRRLSELAAEPGFYLTVLGSLGRVMLGMLLAVLIGIPAAAAAAACHPADRLLSPIVTVIKSTPVVSFIIVAFLWLGSAVLPVFIAFLMAFPLIFTNIREGLRETPPELVRMAKVFRLSPLTKVRRIYAPAAAPYFISAARASLGLAWKAGIAAEVLVYTKNSIGAAISLSKSYLETVDLFAWTAVIVILSLLIEFLFARTIAALAGQTEGTAADAKHHH